MRVAAIIIGVVIVLGLAGVIGLGWLHFGVSNGVESGNPKLEVTVDKEKAKEDLQAVGNKAKELEQEVKDLTAKKVSGRISAVAKDTERLTIKTTDGQAIEVHLITDTKVRVGDRDGSMVDLAPGDAVTVAYVTNNGDNTARTVHVDPAK